MNILNKNRLITEPIVLGKTGSCYGILGWIKLFSLTENIFNIFNYQPWFIRKEDQWLKFNVENFRYQNRNILIKIKGINDRNLAKTLTNREIVIDSFQLPLLKNNNYYWKDIMNQQVVTITGYILGKVINIIETGSNDVLVVKSNKNDSFSFKERLIPFINNLIIKKVDINDKLILVDWDPSFKS